MSSVVDHEPIVLPPAVAPPARPPVPILTAVVPVIGALVLWGLTGSMYALWFAALGPLVAAAGVVDGLRTARRARRRTRADQRSALARAAAEVERRHAEERERLWSRHPDVASFAARPDEVWRTVPGRGDDVVLGRGEAASALRVDGGDGSEHARALQRSARRVADAPVRVPAAGGIAVVGPPVLAAAVVRGLLLQICLTLPPGRVRLVGDDEAWIAALPHRNAVSGAVLCVTDAGRPLPGDVDIPLVRVPEGTPPPPRCAAVLTVTGPDRARLDVDGTTRDVRVEAVGIPQAAAAAAGLAARARATLGAGRDAATGLDALLTAAPSPGVLAAPIGVCGGEPFAIDLAVDGPHAIVIGVTGSGKSELLTTWVTALCAGHDPDRVGFLLVDFKGGRTFDALARLPHVTGVLTDLDDAAALRAIESLRAETRHREAVLAAHGVREIGEAQGALARLVVVVDEYAALVAAHPGLHDLFADLAARGRALGIHLVLASQRAAGVFRDAVLANCPLRVSLRVTDRADSRAVLGVDDAATLPGSPGDRGLALVRRSADPAPSLVRVATTAASTLTAVAASRPGPPARRPWLPTLAEVIPLDELRSPGAIVLGVADEPERQRQRRVVLPENDPGLAIVGRAGSGKTGALQAIAAQSERTRVVPAQPESAWDAVAELETAAPGTVVLVDDVDALFERFPPEYAAAMAERLERCAREARGRGIRLVVSAQRLTGPAGRLADLLPHRALLALTSRNEHVAAGGEASGYVADPPAGRARLDRVLMQFVSVPAPPPADVPAPTPWYPVRETAYAAPPGIRTRAVLAAWAERGARVVRVDAADAAFDPDTVVWGPPDAWTAHWRLLAAARERADLVVDVACAAEYRMLTGSRELPPYAIAGRSRAWLCSGDGGVRRVVLPQDTSRSDCHSGGLLTLRPPRA